MISIRVKGYVSLLVLILLVQNKDITVYYIRQSNGVWSTENQYDYCQGDNWISWMEAVVFGFDNGF